MTTQPNSISANRSPYTQDGNKQMNRDSWVEIICKTVCHGLQTFSSPILLSNDGGEDIPYCDYGHDSDSPRYDALVPTASASQQDVHKDVVFHAQLSSASLHAMQVVFCFSFFFFFPSAPPEMGAIVARQWSHKLRLY